MTTTGKAEYVTIDTPFAQLKFMNFVRPDQRFGNYGATIVLDPGNDKAHKEWMETYEKLCEELFQKELKKLPKGKQKEFRKKLPWTEEVDKEGNETGRFLLKTTTKKAVPCYDSQGQKIDDTTVGKLWGGTVGRLKCARKATVYPPRGTIGFTFYLNAAQIIEPVFGGAGGATFGAVDGGYVAPEGSSDSAEETPPWD